MLQIWNFDLFLGWQYVLRSSLMMLGSGSELKLLGSHAIQRGNIGSTYHHSVSRQPFCFHFQYSIQ